MPTFRRLLGFLRPYRGTVVLSAALAAVAMIMTVAIPWLTGQAIDAIRGDDGARLDRLAIAVAAAGVLRLALPPAPGWLRLVPPLARPLVAGRFSLAVEQDLRQRLYAICSRSSSRSSTASR